MSREPIVVHRGSVRIIVAAVAKDGRAYAKEYLDGLDSAGKKGKVARANLEKTFEKVCSILDYRNTEKFEWLSGDHAKGVCEFKKDQHRLMGCDGGSLQDRRQLLLLTHGFQKKKRKTPRTQIQRALRIKAEYQERVRGR